ncbi:unnamed protein product [Meloidogyne enterolobii]|uniref:Uncharacterized protein n=1 Tax=Meloidogyne enterolobii TaxID=390850 RepID=A0ACB1AEH7_MELEN
MDKLLIQQLALYRKLKKENNSCQISQNNKLNDLKNNITKLSQPIINKNSEISKILSELINVENKKNYIRNSRHGISIELLFKRKLEDFLDESYTNLLNLYEKFEPGPPPSVDSTEIEDLKEGRNINKQRPSYYFMNLYLSIELIRTMPFYEELSISDKVLTYLL